MPFSVPSLDLSRLPDLPGPFSALVKSASAFISTHPRLSTTTAFFAAYLLLVRSLRWRRYYAIHKKYEGKWRRGELTPAEAQEIMHTSVFWDQPLLMNKSLAFALFKSYDNVSGPFLGCISWRYFVWKSGCVEARTPDPTYPLWAANTVFRRKYEPTTSTSNMLLSHINIKDSPLSRCPSPESPSSSSRPSNSAPQRTLPDATPT